MNLEELRRKYLDNGFSLANASAKICQDIILNKRFRFGLYKIFT